MNVDYKQENVPVQEVGLELRWWKSGITYHRSHCNWCTCSIIMVKTLFKSICLFAHVKSH